MAQNSSNDDRPLLRRFVLWYPVVAAVLIALAVWASPWRSGTEAPEELPAGGATEEASGGATGAEATPPAETVEAEETDEAGRLAAALESGRATGEAAREKAGAVAGLFGARLSGLADWVDGEALVRKGETAARFVPFVGPYVRYHRARRTWAGGDEEEREAAKRQTVIALAELAIDAGSAGLGKAASGTGDLTDALAGAVDVADFMDSALSIHEVLGEPLHLGGLAAATRSVDKAAGFALENVSGLDEFCVMLLEIDPEELAELASNVPEWVSEVVEDIEASTSASEESEGSDG